MNQSRPPALATWLLALTDSNAWLDAAVGDVFEEYRRRGSAKWYWRQVLTILAVGVLRDLRKHWLLASRAIAVAVLSMVVVQRLHLSSRLLEGTVLPALGFWPYVALDAAFEPFLICAPAGLVVALTHRKSQAAMVLAYVAALFAFLVCLCANRAPLTLESVLFWGSSASALLGALAGGLLGCALAHPPHRFRAELDNGRLPSAM